MKSIRKRRVNLSMHDDVVQKGEQLARIERRSFSNLVEILISRATVVPPTDSAPAPKSEEVAA